MAKQLVFDGTETTVDKAIFMRMKVLTSDGDPTGACHYVGFSQYLDENHVIPTDIDVCVASANVSLATAGFSAIPTTSVTEAKLFASVLWV